MGLVKRLIKRNEALYNFLIFEKNRWTLMFAHIIPFFFCGCMRLLKIKKYYEPYKPVEKYKNSANKDRCFVIATGPSLTTQDIEKLSEEVTFGVNSIFTLYDKTDFRPTYYVSGDYKLWDEWLEQGKKFSLFDLARDGIFLSHPIKKIFNRYQLNDEHVTYVPVCWLDHYANGIKSRWMAFCKNILFGIVDNFTVTNMAINIAVYMGYKKIYLLGCDCNYLGVKAHVGDDEIMEEKKAVAGVAAMKRGYEYVNKKIKKIGVRVYNVTRGGDLEVFERKNFDDIL